jgi:hypothetical protein
LAAFTCNGSGGSCPDPERLGGAFRCRLGEFLRHGQPMGVPDPEHRQTLSYLN